MSFGNFVMPWTKHVRTGRDLVRRAFDVANRIGDLTFAAYSCNNLNTNLLAAGDPLGRDASVKPRMVSSLRRRRDSASSLTIITAQLQLIRTLRGLTPTFGCFDEEQFDERRFEHDLASQADLALAECWYWIRKLQARVLAGDYRSAIDASSKARPLLWTSPSFFETAEYEFYSGLCRAALCDCTLPDERRNISRLWPPTIASSRSGQRTVRKISRTAPHWWAQRSLAWKGENSMPNISTKRPSGQRMQTALSTMRHSQTNSPHDSTRRVVSKRSQMPICRTLGTAISVGEPMAR